MGNLIKDTKSFFGAQAKYIRDGKNPDSKNAREGQIAKSKSAAKAGAAPKTYKVIDKAASAGAGQTSEVVQVLNTRGKTRLQYKHRTTDLQNAQKHFTDVMTKVDKRFEHIGGKGKGQTEAVFEKLAAPQGVPYGPEHNRRQEEASHEAIEKQHNYAAKTNREMPALLATRDHAEASLKILNEALSERSDQHLTGDVLARHLDKNQSAELRKQRQWFVVRTAHKVQKSFLAPLGSFFGRTGHQAAITGAQVGRAGALLVKLITSPIWWPLKKAWEHKKGIYRQLPLTPSANDVAVKRAAKAHGKTVKEYRAEVRAKHKASSQSSSDAASAESQDVANPSSEAVASSSGQSSGSPSAHNPTVGHEVADDHAQVS